MATRLSVYDRTRIAARMEVWQSPIMVQRWWRMVKGRNATLDYKTIKRLHANLIRTGSVTQQKGAGRPKTVITEEAKAAATEAFQRSPKKSIRQYQRESGVSYGSVQRLLKEMNWRPWKPHFVQALSCEDCDIRMEFAESLLAWIQEEPNLLRHILWSDERSVAGCQMKCL